MIDARDALRMVVRNGGTQTFLKCQTPDQLLESLRHLSCQGYLECVGETRQVIIYRTFGSPPSHLVDKPNNITHMPD